MNPFVEPSTTRGRRSFRSFLVVVACILAAAIPSISSAIVLGGIGAAPAVEDPVTLDAPDSQGRAVRAVQADAVIGVRKTVEVVMPSDTRFGPFTLAEFAITTRAGPPPALRGPPALLF